MIQLSKCCDWSTKLVTDVGVSEILICDRCGRTLGPNDAYDVIPAPSTPPQAGTAVDVKKCANEINNHLDGWLRVWPEIEEIESIITRHLTPSPVVAPAESVKTTSDNVWIAREKFVQEHGLPEKEFELPKKVAAMVGSEELQLLLRRSVNQLCCPAPGMTLTPVWYETRSRLVDDIEAALQRAVGQQP